MRRYYSTYLLKETTSLSRLLQHLDNKNCALGMITAYTCYNSSRKNQEANKMLKKDLDKRFLSYSKIQGNDYCKDEESGEIYEVIQETLVVMWFDPRFKIIPRRQTDVKSKEEFKGLLLRLAKKYNQWGILYAEGGTNRILILDSDGNIANTLRVDFKLIKSGDDLKKYWREFKNTEMKHRAKRRKVMPDEPQPYWSHFHGKLISFMPESYIEKFFEILAKKKGLL